jgi:putative SOS response-associated peptidase YedK
MLMCSAGYIASRAKLGREVSEFFATIEEMANLPRRTIRPTNESPFVRIESDGRRHLRHLHWGLIPHWAKDKKIAYQTFNARCETLAETPSFREPFRRRRGILAWTGYVEWREENSKNIPYEFTLASGEPIGFAGLWDRWGEQEAQIESCTMVTTTPNELAVDYQDRMPVILHPEDYDLWLDPSAKPQDLLALLTPFPADLMVVGPANPDDFLRKNAARVDGTKLLEL